MTIQLTETPPLRRDSVGQPIGVDRAKGAILGVIIAEVGPFKTSRGQFTEASLRRIVALMQLADSPGIKCRWQHPNDMSDGLGDLLGRFRNARLDGPSRVRADLIFNGVALAPPPGGGVARGLWLMSVAKSDPAAIGASLVVATDKLTERRGQLPVWMPREIQAIDIVDRGDATSSLLGADQGGGTLAAARARHRHRLRLAARKATLDVERLRAIRRHKQRLAAHVG